MGAGLHDLPDDVEALNTALIAERERRLVAEADAVNAKAKASDDRAQIAHLKLQIEKLRREIYGPRSEGTARLFGQLELQLEELESSATEDELAAEKGSEKTSHVAALSGGAYCKYGLHLPLNRQSAAFAREGTRSTRSRCPLPPAPH
jgi:transposase